MNSNVKTDNRTIRAYAIAMSLACALVASNAYADDQVRSETVKFADLNLGTPAGVEALYGRVHAAARRVCEQPAGELGATRACMTKAESEAIGKVNVPLLTAFYQKKTGINPQTITANR
jgi:UrcA family protein